MADFCQPLHRMGEKLATARGLDKILRELSTTFGVAENLTSDDGPQFRAHDTQEFLARAESAVKTRVG